MCFPYANIVPPFSYPEVFWYTLVFMGIGGAIVSLAVGLRHLVRSRLDHSVPPTQLVAESRRRLEHAILIWLSIMYLRMTQIEVLSFICQEFPDEAASSASNAPLTQSLYLKQDLEVSARSLRYACTCGVMRLIQSSLVN